MPVTQARVRLYAFPPFAVIWNSKTSTAAACNNSFAFARPTVRVSMALLFTRAHRPIHAFAFFDLAVIIHFRWATPLDCCSSALLQGSVFIFEVIFGLYPSAAETLYRFERVIGCWRFMKLKAILTLQACAHVAVLRAALCGNDVWIYAWVQAGHWKFF